MSEQNVKANNIGQMTWKEFFDLNLSCGQLPPDKENIEGCHQQDWNVTEITNEQIGDCNIHCATLQCNNCQALTTIKIPDEFGLIQDDEQKPDSDS